MHAFTQIEVVIVGIYFTIFTISQPASPARKRPHVHTARLQQKEEDKGNNRQSAKRAGWHTDIATAPYVFR